MELCTSFGSLLAMWALYQHLIFWWKWDMAKVLKHIMGASGATHATKCMQPSSERLLIIGSGG
jgi:hypothetical protein